MAHICGSCLNLTPTLNRGMCPTCNATNNRTRRPSTSHRYPTEYHRNRATLLRDNPDCVWCGAPATTADHYPTPVAHGGGHDLDNLVPACKSCNSRRGQAQTHPPQAQG